MTPVRLLLLAAALGLLMAAAGIAWLQAGLREPLAIGDDGLILEVPTGDSVSALASRLQRDGVLGSARVLTLWARLTGDAGRIKAGEYEVGAGTTAAGLLRQLVEGDVKLYALTLVEGWNWREVRDAVAGADFLRPTQDFGTASAMAEALALEPPHPEGMIFPDTYKVARGTTDVDLLRRGAGLMAERLERAWESRQPDLPLQNAYELLILASIIERETSVDDERARVAGVFTKRLRRGMRLQTDPTVIYGLGEAFDGNLRRRDLLTDTPYNTYTRGGLPPTPISMPGEASLQAAAAPEEGEALYFVASPELDGRHVFSATLEEHNAAVAAYIAALRRARQQGR